ncbi:MAG: agmatinase [Methylocystis sp.]|uniref:agmatinase n=1 Tax=Methylocystis sp. TaxID=1911079 RepID=UPI003D14B5CB
MSGAPTFAARPTFLGVEPRTDAAVVVAGVPYDIGTTNRSGARFGPAAIRHASRMLVDGEHPAHWTSPVDLPLADVGDFAIALGDIAASLKLIEEQASNYAHLVTLGGEHGITLPLLRACARTRGPLALIHFDAHVDTWPDNFGQPYAHGSMFYHAINEGVVEPRRMIQIGIRSPVQRDVYDWTVGQGVTIVAAQAAHEIGPAAVASRIIETVGDAPVYLTFDVDALDPAFAPGTGTPEIGGLANWQAQSIIRRLGGLNFVGMDVVEVAPAYDVSEITALAGATMAWEYLCLLRAAGRSASASPRPRLERR